MKTFLLAAVIFIGTSALGQTLPKSGAAAAPGKPGIAPHRDTTLRVISYLTESKRPGPPRAAVYLNGKMVHLDFLNSLDQNLIESFNVDKESFEIDNVKYSGRIYIKTKSSYSAQLISLTELKEKYTNLKNEAAIITIDGEIIKSDYDKYVVDESRLWRIYIDKVENEKENLNVKFIKLLTKSEENLKKEPVINIRGAEVAIRE